MLYLATNIGLSNLKSSVTMPLPSIVRRDSINCKEDTWEESGLLPENITLPPCLSSTRKPESEAETEDISIFVFESKFLISSILLIETLDIFLFSIFGLGIGLTKVFLIRKDCKG